MLGVIRTTPPLVLAENCIIKLSDELNWKTEMNSYTNLYLEKKIVLVTVELLSNAGIKTYRVTLSTRHIVIDTNERNPSMHMSELLVIRKNFF